MRDRRIGVELGDHVEQRRLAGGERRLERRPIVAGSSIRAARQPQASRDPGMVDGGEIAGVGMGAEQHVLGVLLIAEHLVVEHREHHRQAHPARGLQLGPDMGEAAVAGEADDGPLGRRDLGAERQRQSPAQTGDAARREEAHARPEACR